MSLAALTALSNVATLLILCCGAVAAVVQMRYVRAAKELQAVLAVDARFAEPELQAALLYVQAELPIRLTEPRYRAELIALGYIDPRVHPEMLVCHWFNQNGTLIAGGLLNEDVFLDTFGRLVEYYWRLLEPTIDLLRRERGANYDAKFEWLATRARAWRARHHGGGYPAALPRLPIVDPWAEIDRRDDVGVASA